MEISFSYATIQKQVGLHGQQKMEDTNIAMGERLKEERFFYSVCRLAIPVALQSILQASFSVIDQIMIGQLGSVDVAAVGLAGKFTGFFAVVVSAVSTAAGIMISQYLGQRNRIEVRKSLSVRDCSHKARCDKIVEWN